MNNHSQSKRIKAKSIFASIVLAALAFNPGSRADLILDWNKTASAHLSRNAPSAFQPRVLAMLHVAQFDAVNAVLGGYTPYFLNVAAPNASPEAAAAQAAYTVLTNISRANLTLLNTALAQSLAPISNGPAKDDGIDLGRLAADAIIRLRAGDNLDLDVPAVTSTAPGGWRPTLPNFAPGEGGPFRYLAPWTMRSASQFRPGPPPPLNGGLYATDYNEVRLLGSSTSTARTPEQTMAAQRREIGEDFLQDVLALHPLPLIESARLMALHYMAWTDAVIQVFDAKYTYNFWRPITAIRAGDVDGNSATVRDASWTPFMNTHAHPDYPSQLVQITAARVEVLISVLGDDFSFSVSSSGSASLRTFPRLSAYIQDAIEARVAGGTHFRNSCNVGADVGRRIARHALQNYLWPVPNLRSGVMLNTGEFQLHLTPGSAVTCVIETSSDLEQWLPWQTNIYGLILLTDTNAAATDRRFYRASFLLR